MTESPWNRPFGGNPKRASFATRSSTLQIARLLLEQRAAELDSESFFWLTASSSMKLSATKQLSAWLTERQKPTLMPISCRLKSTCTFGTSYG